MHTFLKEYFKGVNFITPHIVDRKKINDNLFYELSRGDAFDSDAKDFLYGVTVANKRSTVHSLGKCFYDRESAEKYIKTLYVLCGQESQ